MLLRYPYLGPLSQPLQQVLALYPVTISNVQLCVMYSEVLLVKLFVCASFGLDNHKTNKTQGENKLSDGYNCLNPDQSSELQCMNTNSKVK